MAEFFGFELKEFDTSTLNAGYQNLGSASTRSAKGIHIFNTSTVDIYISADGATNALRVPAGKDIPIHGYFDAPHFVEGKYVLKANTQLKIKQVTGAAAGAAIVHIFT